MTHYLKAKKPQQVNELCYSAALTCYGTGHSLHLLLYLRRRTSATYIGMKEIVTGKLQNLGLFPNEVEARLGFQHNFIPHIINFIWKERS